MTKLIVAFRNYAKAPKNRLHCVSFNRTTEQFPPPSKLLWHKFPTRGSNLEDLTGKLKGQSGMSTGSPTS